MTMDYSYEKLNKIKLQCENRLERLKLLNSQRKKASCSFEDGISSSEFESIAHDVAKKFERITDVFVSNATIYCDVKSQTGMSTWVFSVDFNDWGHITGIFWRNSDNDVSDIPKYYATAVSKEISESLKERNIQLKRYHDVVCDYFDLGQLSNFNNKDTTFWKKILEFIIEKLKKRRIQNFIHIKKNHDQLAGEHLFNVIAYL